MLGYKLRSQTASLKKSDLYRAEGKLRPLARTLLDRRMARVVGRLVHRRPVPKTDHWSRYCFVAVYRNGYQQRVLARLFQKRLDQVRENARRAYLQYQLHQEPALPASPQGG